MVFTINDLCDACSSGDIQRVRDIVNSKEVDINDSDYDGYTSLMWAMDDNQADIVRFLLTQPHTKITKFV